MKLLDCTKVYSCAFDGVIFNIDTLKDRRNEFSPLAIEFVQSLAQSLKYTERSFVQFGSYITTDSIYLPDEIRTCFPERLLVRAFNPTPADYQRFLTIIRRISPNHGQTLVIDASWYRAVAAVRAGASLVIMPSGLPDTDEALGKGPRSRAIKEFWWNKFVNNEPYGQGEIRIVPDFSRLEIVH